MRAAVIIGWGASQLRIVEKYAPVYSEKGFKTICTHMPLRIGMWPPLANRMSSDVIKKLDAMSLELPRQPDGKRKPLDVVFHLFSGSSFIFMPNIFARLERPDTNWRIRCVVHDSGPTLFTVHVCVSGFGMALTQNRSKVGSALIRFAFPPLFRIVDFAVGEKHRSTMREVMASPHMSVPQLFLYSRNDSVIHWREIEERISEQKQRGVSVSSHRWESSEHVSHFVKHQKEYKHVVGEFVDKHLPPNTEAV